MYNDFFNKYLFHLINPSKIPKSIQIQNRNKNKNNKFTMYLPHTPTKGSTYQKKKQNPTQHLVPKPAAPAIRLPKSLPNHASRSTFCSPSFITCPPSAERT